MFYLRQMFSPWNCGGPLSNVKGHPKAQNQEYVCGVIPKPRVNFKKETPHALS